MDQDVAVSLIANVTTILVGILTAVVAYKASIKGAKVQIEHERAILQNEVRQQDKLTKSIIELFVLHELKKNFKLINSDYVTGYMAVNPTPFQHGMRTNEFVFEEFNRVKFDLIKFDSNLVKEIIRIYSMFYLIQRKGDIKDLTQEEYEEFKHVYEICKTKYSD